MKHESAPVDVLIEETILSPTVIVNRSSDNFMTLGFRTSLVKAQLVSCIFAEVMDKS